jgi:hypothetical protein
MLIRTLALSTFLALVALQPLSASDLACLEISRWGERGTAASFAVDGSRLFVADGRGVALYDLSDPNLIRQLSTLRTRHASRQIGLLGSDRLVVLTTESLELLSIDGDRLMLLGSTPVQAQALAIGNQLIVTAGSELQRWVIAGDRLVPSGPAFRPSRSVGSLLIDGNHLYAGMQPSGIDVYAIGSSFEPIAFIPATALAMVRSGSSLFTAAGAGFYEIDVSNPAAPQLIGLFGASSGDFRSIAAINGQVALGQGDRFLQLYGRSDGWQLIDTLEIPATALAVAGSRLLSGGRSFDRFFLPLQNPVAFRSLSIDGGRFNVEREFTEAAAPRLGVATNGRLAYVADPPYLRVIEIGLVPREITSVWYGDESDRVRLEGNRLLVYGRGDVHIFELSSPEHPVWRGVYYALGTSPNDARMAGPYLLEANRGSGFHLLDISNPAVPVHLSGLRNDGYGQWIGMAAMEGYAYGIAARGIKVVDLTDPHDAEFVHFIGIERILGAEVMQHPAGSLLLVLDGTSLRIFDLAVPLQPMEIAVVDLFEPADLTVDGTNAWVVSVDGQAARVDLSDPRRPVVHRFAASWMMGRDIAAAGGIFAIADDYSVRFHHQQRGDDGPVGPLRWTRVPAQRAALVEWAGAGDLFEIATSSDPEFAQSQTRHSIQPSLLLSLDGPLHVRVRSVSACGAGAWSEPLLIGAGNQPRVVFAESGRRVVMPPDTQQQSVGIPLRNLEAVPVTVQLQSDASAGITLPSPVTLAPHERREVTIQIDSSAAAASQLSLDDGSGAESPSRYLLRVDRPVVQEGPRSGSASLLVPGVGATAGAAGTRWKSDLHLFCERGPCSVTAGFTSAASPDREHRTSLELQQGETLVVEDAIARLFGLDGVSGTVGIATPPGQTLRAAAYTYNDSPHGKYGQRIPGSLTGDASRGRTLRLAGIAADHQARTNLGLVNPHGHAVQVEIDLRDDRGVSAGSRSLLLAPLASQMIFVSELAGGVAIPAGYATISASEPIVAYASRIDQQSGDATFSYGLPVETATGGAALFEQVGSTAGAAGTRWKTAIQLTPLDGDATVDLLYIPANGGSSTQRTITLTGGASFVSEDLFGDLLAEVSPAEASAGMLRVESAERLSGWGRIYNDSVDGTFGQNLPLRRSDQLAAGRALQMFPLGDTSGVRSNVTLVETAGKPASARLTLFDASGALLAMRDVSLTSHSSVQLLSILRELGAAGASDVRLEVSQISGSGRISGFASVVQNSTGDAMLIVAE